MVRRSTALVLAAGMVATLAGAGPTRAYGCPGWATPAEFAAEGHALTEAEQAELAYVALDFGLSHEEAMARYGWQHRFITAVDRLAASYPDRFAGAAIVDNGCAGRISFRGQPPDRAYALMRSVPARVEVIGGRGFAEEELLDVLHDAYYRVYSHPQIVDAAGGPNQETGVIRIVAQPAGPVVDPVRLCGELRPPRPKNRDIRVVIALAADLDTHDLPVHIC